MAKPSLKPPGQLPKRIQPKTAPRQVARIGRNERCPCGSGKKFKDCHEPEGDTFLLKIAQEQEKKRLKEERDRMKAAGVPWYKRLFVR